MVLKFNGAAPRSQGAAACSEVNASHAPTPGNEEPYAAESAWLNLAAWLAVSSVGLLLGWDVEVTAQPVSDPPAATQEISPRPAPSLVDPPAPLPPLDTVPDWEAPPVDAPVPANPGTDRLFVAAFEVVGSTVFSSDDFAQATADFVNRDLLFNDLLQVRSAITQLYVDAGYITSVALLPPQTPESNIVRIQVIEGSLEAIEVRGTNRLQSRYIRDRLARADRVPLNTDRIVAALQLLQLDPRIQRTSAELAAGTRLGQSVLTVDVTEANTVGVDVLLNTNRSPNVGSFERGFLLEELNLFGRGDRFTLGWRNTDGSDVLSSSYSYPLNAKEGTLSLDITQSWGEVVEEPFDRLGITSEAADFTLSFRQPLVLEPSAEVSLGVSGFLRRARTEFEDFGFRFPLRGADGDGRSRLSVLRFDQDGLWRG
ncbi:MAG: POTRA domain-containing protein, partial [Cyanobacteria bacterium J06555_12]